MSSSPERLLEMYLADHAAAATAGLELALRTARSNASTPFGDALRGLADEIEDDRRTLRRVVSELGFKESRTKEALAWAAERVGRLKLNGQERLADLDLEELSARAERQRDEVEKQRRLAVRNAFTA